MGIKIIKSNEGRSQYLRMMVYGVPGSGKTVFGSTAPDPLILDAEAGLLSIADKKLDTVKIETFQDVINVFNFLKTEKLAYKTVVIDSLTELQRKSMDLILSKAGRDRATIGDWGMNIDQVRNIIRYFRDLEMNLLLICLNEERKDEDAGIIMQRPALQGRTLPEEVMGYVDVVGYLFTKEVEGTEGKKQLVRKILCQPHERAYAKDRSGKLDRFEEPDFKKIYTKIFGSPSSSTQERSSVNKDKEASHESKR
ncbi:MAG: ATP-binding protein [Elusimicrobiota bacterium]